MPGSVSYIVTRIRLNIMCSALGSQSPCSLNESHCFAFIQACQGIIVIVLFTNIRINSKSQTNAGCKDW